MESTRTPRQCVAAVAKYSERGIRLFHAFLPGATARGHHGGVRVWRKIFSSRGTRQFLRSAVSSRKVRCGWIAVATKLWLALKINADETNYRLFGCRRRTRGEGRAIPQLARRRRSC